MPERSSLPPFSHQHRRAGRLDAHQRLHASRIGDLVERRGNTYTLHGRAPDTLKAPDGRRITTRDVDQCFLNADGLLHYRLHETSLGNFQLAYISEDGSEAKPAVTAALQN